MERESEKKCLGPNRNKKISAEKREKGEYFCPKCKSKKDSQSVSSVEKRVHKRLGRKLSRIGHI